MLALFLALALSHPGPPPAEAECKSAFGQTVCGFGCIAAYGAVKCARTPEGRCQAAYGEITCWDPDTDAPRPGPGRPGRPNPWPDRDPGNGASCENAFGKTACGYDCKTAFGDIKCAQTPLGVCHAAYGKLVCWDPPRWVRSSEKARCETAYGEIVCGYRCVSAYGRTRCASSPQGACKAAYGDVTCSD